MRRLLAVVLTICVWGKAAHAGSINRFNHTWEVVRWQDVYENGFDTGEIAELFSASDPISLLDGQYIVTTGTILQCDLSEPDTNRLRPPDGSFIAGIFMMPRGAFDNTQAPTKSQTHVSLQWWATIPGYTDTAAACARFKAANYTITTGIFVYGQVVRKGVKNVLVVDHMEFAQYGATGLTYTGKLPLGLIFRLITGM